MLSKEPFTPSSLNWDAKLNNIFVIEKTFLNFENYIKPKMLVFPNAKINLGLNIVSKRVDGFHDIESVFYPIAWSDALEVIKSDTFEMHFTGLKIPGDIESNLIFKAWKVFQSENRIKENVKIHLHKVLPMGAGIGGGSSDAAFALKTFDSVFETGNSNNKLEEMAAGLGSDCPFFVQNRPRFCFERGTEFQDIEVSLAGKYIVLVNPDIHISTKEAYSGVIPKVPNISIKEILKTPITNWKGLLVNDFESAITIKYPKIGSIKEKLYLLGANYASMTGSGSTVFGIFDNKVNIDKIFQGFLVWTGTLN
jgi:4-diphosphocytidyl-2-C-methyl-D-erythritol kinase